MASERFLTPPRPRIDPPIPQNKPVYRILNEQGFFGPDDTLHPTGAIIVLHDDPSEDMEPLNELARVRHDAVCDALDKSGREVANFNGRYFAPARTKQDMLDHATEDAHRVKSLTNPNGVAIMGAKLDSSKRIEAAFSEEVPETGAKKPGAAKRAKIETISG